ncbi:hypothetical protein K466DRAFT_237608 [Polyporus arcularius HHB13444]|uniref:Uncharacterized protein n=1 Tax=Polyporus arcularius HHB13444 TaxID=1314778 RepID=A0A5C3P5D8_9APHY|nr:hypothetical protein K466DRAFT_237608 [Polyporus arcularius HHB13444]
MSLTVFPNRLNTPSHSPYSRSPGTTFSPRSAFSVWPPAMYRPPPPRLDTTYKLPRDPSNWVDTDLLSYVDSHYTASESLSAVELIRDNRLTPRALWFLQTDHDALSHLASDQSLREFVLSLAQSVQPAVSPTTPRVKHIRRLSHDFAHPPPPPTPPAPSPSLPEESELEEDDDVAESVISDWALDGDNDEIQEVREAPSADAAPAEATPGPALAPHADPANGENTLGLDIGGEPTHSSELVEPTPQPTASTSSGEESLIDFQDAPESASQASPEPFAHAPEAVDAAEDAQVCPQTTEEPTPVQREHAEDPLPSSHVPEATDEPPSEASRRVDPFASQNASERAGSGESPGMFGPDDDLGDPKAQRGEAETTAEPSASEETPASVADRPEERAGSEVPTAVEAEREPPEPFRPDASTSHSTPGDAESSHPDAAPEIRAEVKSGDGEPALPVKTEAKPSPTPPEGSPESVAAVDKLVTPAPVEELVASTGINGEQVTSSPDVGEIEPTRLVGSEHGAGDDQEALSTSQQGQESIADAASTTTQQGSDETSGHVDVQDALQEKQTPQSPSPPAVVDSERRSDELNTALSGDDREADDLKSKLDAVEEPTLLSPGARITPDIPTTAATIESSTAVRGGELSQAEKGMQRIQGEEVREAQETAARGEERDEQADEPEAEDGTQAESDNAREVKSDSRHEPADDGDGAKEQKDPTDTVQATALIALSGLGERVDSAPGQTQTVSSSDPPEDQRSATASFSTETTEHSPSYGDSSQSTADLRPSPTVKLASGSEVVIVGRDSECDYEAGRETLVSRVSAAPGSARLHHGHPSANTGRAERSGPTPWPPSPGLDSLNRRHRSPPPLNTNVSSLLVSQRSVDTPSRSTVFSPQHTISSSATKTTGWGALAPRNLFTTVTSFAFNTGSPTSDSSPSTTRDSSQERQPLLSRMTSRPSPPVRSALQPVLDASKLVSPPTSHGTGSHSDSTTASVLDQAPHKMTPLPAGEAEAMVRKELKTAMSDSLLRVGAAHSHTDNAEGRRPTQESSRQELPSVETDDVDNEDYVEIRSGDLPEDSDARGSAEQDPETQAQRNEGVDSRRVGGTGADVPDSRPIHRRASSPGKPPSWSGCADARRDR